MKKTGMSIAMLLSVVVCAAGCANKDVVKKDENLSSASSQNTVDAAKSTSQSNDGAKKQQADTKNSQQNVSRQHTISAPVYFGFDSYILTTESRNTLQENYNKLEGKPSIQVEGHCDERGSSEYNLALGEKRAKAAQTYLVTLGYPAERISTISYGKEHPAVAGHDEASWDKNRRAEFAVVQ